MATFLAPLKFWIAYLIRQPRKPYHSCEKVLDFLRRTVVCAILAYFCPNLVAMVTAFATMKFR